jgi:hypothetical protein
LNFVEPDNQYPIQPRQWSQQVHYPPPIDMYANIPYQMDTRQSERTTHLWGLVVVSANVVFAALVFAGMAWSGSTILMSILIAAFYYAATTLVALAFMSGQIRFLWEAFLHFRLEHRRLRSIDDAAERELELRLEQERTRQLELQLMHVPQRPPAIAAPFGEGNYVARDESQGQLSTAQLPQEAKEALRWLRKLYDASGDPAAAEVLPNGRLRRATIGGAKAGGSREARHWLEEQRILQAISGGHALNLRHFNSWDAVLSHLRKSYIF